MTWVERNCPGLVWIKIRDEFGFSDDPMSPSLDSPMVLLNRLVEIVVDILEVCFLCIGNEVLYIAMQVALVALERQYIVASLINDGLSNLGLASHCINGDDTSIERQQTQQFRNSCDFIRFL